MMSKHLEMSCKDTAQTITTFKTSDTMTDNYREEFLGSVQKYVPRILQT